MVIVEFLFFICFNRHMSGSFEEQNRDGILSALSPESTPSAKVDSLMAIGLKTREIARAVGSTNKTVLQWLDGVRDQGRVTPRVETLGYLSAAMHRLIEGGASPGSSRAFLLSRADLPPEYPRPIDMLRDEPNRVIELAGELAVKLGTGEAVIVDPS
jgi:hypothetical protein